jgi:hypothetical protein
MALEDVKLGLKVSTEIRGDCYAAVEAAFELGTSATALSSPKRPLLSIRRPSTAAARIETFQDRQPTSGAPITRPRRFPDSRGAGVRAESAGRRGVGGRE